MEFFDRASTTPRNPKSARWLRVPLLLLVLGTTATAWAADVPISDAARQHFSAGVNLLQDPDGARYDEAYREFKTAYADSPSWKILSNLGIAAMKLERDGEAADAFKKYLAEGGTQIEADERAQVERDLQTLQAGLISLNLESDPPGALITDERVPVAGSPVVNRYGPFTQPTVIGVRGGHHRMTASLAGYQDSVWEFDSPSQGPGHAFKLEKTVVAPPMTPGGGTTAQPTVERPVPTGVYIGIAATGALAAGGAVVGIMASSKKSKYDTANNNIHTQADRDAANSLKKSGTQLNLIADGLFAGAVVAAGVTTVLYFTRPSHEVVAGSWHVTPAVAANGGGLLLTGGF